MRATIASLLNLNINDLPNYIELGNDWFNQMLADLKKYGYKYDGMYHNKNYTRLLHPTDNCFKSGKWHRPSIITPKCLYKEKGIDGYFYAGVLSPKFFNWQSLNSHAVVIDKNFNIIHDPNPNYHNILEYPLKSLLGYNGIIDIYIFNSLT